jgi:hypothetical protein
MSADVSSRVGGMLVREGNWFSADNWVVGSAGVKEIVETKKEQKIG